MIGARPIFAHRVAGDRARPLGQFAGDEIPGAAMHAGGVDQPRRDEHPRPGEESFGLQFGNGRADLQLVEAPAGLDPEPSPVQPGGRGGDPEHFGARPMGEHPRPARERRDGSRRRR